MDSPVAIFDHFGDLGHAHFRAIGGVQGAAGVMVAARSHIEETLKNLVMREHQARQEEITDEIVELSATADTR